MWETKLKGKGKKTLNDNVDKKFMIMGILAE